MKKLISLLFILVSPVFAQYIQLDIAHFNDVYEIQTLSDGQVGGAARVATLINEMRQRDGKEPLILFSGDAFSPSLLSTIYKGEQMVTIFNALGTDYAVWGNHEFDYGPDLAAERNAQSNFPWLSANLLDKRDGKPFISGKASDLVEWGGLKVGIVGLVSDWADLTTLGENTEYQDYVTVGRRIARQLKAQGADVVIAITHMDMADDRILAAQVPEIDLILGGHDHDPMEEMVNDTLIWKTGSDFKTFGDLRLYYFPNQDKVVLLAQNIAVTDAIAEEPTVATIVAEYEKELDAALGAVIGESTVALDAQRSSVRTQESNYGNLIADAMRAYANTDVAIANGGGIRTDMLHEAGPISKGDVQAVLPFGNLVISTRVTGAQLKAAIENGVSQYENGAGRFPQVSGMSYAFDQALPAGERVTALMVAGSPLDEAAEYTVAINDYMGTGGDGYAVFIDSPRIMTAAGGRLLAEVVMDYISANTPVAPQVEGRITIK